MATANEGRSQQGVAERSARFALRSWGDFALFDAIDGRDVTPRGRKARGIIALLASRPGIPVSRERLVAFFWAERGEAQARASLRQSLFELRNHANGAQLLTIDRNGVCLPRENFLDSLDRLNAFALSGDISAMVTMLAEGRQWFDDLEGLGTTFDEWLASERTYRHETLLQLGLGAGEAALAGDPRGVSALVHRLHDIDALNEGVARLGMRLDAACGDTAMLERRFQQLRTLLASELGVEPSTESRAVHQHCLDLLHQEAAAAPFATGALRAGEGDPKMRWLSPYRSLSAAITALLMLTLSASTANPMTGIVDRASIAILPFHSFAASDDDFAEGLSDDVASLLARDSTLEVLGRSSTAPHGRPPMDARALGRELDVAYLLEGSVGRAGPQVRVDVSLIRVRDGARLWSERYGGEVGNIFKIQNNIGAAVARQLHDGLPECCQFDGNRARLGAFGLRRDRLVP